jgi:hypothetical protein
MPGCKERTWCVETIRYGSHLSSLLRLGRSSQEHWDREQAHTREAQVQMLILYQCWPFPISNTQIMV